MSGTGSKKKYGQVGPPSTRKDKNKRYSVRSILTVAERQTHDTVSTPEESLCPMPQN